MKKQDWLENLFQRTTQGIKPGLEVISALLEALGNPHQQLAVVHVAGTNGKGSVCTMIDSVLRASGFKTALYTSPHLLHFSERFRINGQPIPDARLEALATSLIDLSDQVAQKTGLRPATFFEISTALAFLYFQQEKVDIVILETGMGGRWDATNVVIPLLSILTHIDVDHTRYLGDNLEQIAHEKAGIIKPGRPVISAPQSSTVRSVLLKETQNILWSEEQVSITRTALPQRLKIETPSRSLPPIQLPLWGACQRENCAVATSALEILADILDFEPAFKKGFESVIWPARLQCLQENPPILLDGAHNPDAAHALVQSLKELYPHHQIGFILGFLDDKDTNAFLQEIKPIASNAWIIPLNGDRAADPEKITQQAKNIGLNAHSSPSILQAWDASSAWLTHTPHRVLCITGSLFLPQTLAENKLFS